MLSQYSALRVTDINGNMLNAANCITVEDKIAPVVIENTRSA
jgi:hypothetical protein